MALKDILVHLDDGPRCETRLDVAVALATKDGARLRGLFAQSDPNVPGPIAQWPTAYFKEAAKRSEKLFMERAGAAQVAGEWSEITSGAHDVILREVILAASISDLAVIGQHDPEHGQGRVPADLAEQTILHCGRPVLVVPFAGRFATLGQRVLIAWNGGREAVRAVNDALPLMAGAKEVRLVSINPGPDDRIEKGMVRHLACHGIPVEAEHLVAQDIGVMDLLLSRAADMGADLMVVGAYGHYGFPFIHRGGGTRHLLAHMTAPMMISH